MLKLLRILAKPPLKLFLLVFIDGVLAVTDLINLFIAIDGSLNIFPFNIDAYFLDFIINIINKVIYISIFFDRGF